jgi:hypothetical protein
MASAAPGTGVLGEVAITQRVHCSAFAVATRGARRPGARYSAMFRILYELDNFP